MTTIYKEPVVKTIDHDTPVTLEIPKVKERDINIAFEGNALADRFNVPVCEKESFEENGIPKIKRLLLQACSRRSLVYTHANQVEGHGTEFYSVTPLSRIDGDNDSYEFVITHRNGRWIRLQEVDAKSILNSYGRDTVNSFVVVQCGQGIGQDAKVIATHVYTTNQAQTEQLDIKASHQTDMYTLREFMHDILGVSSRAEIRPNHLFLPRFFACLEDAPVHEGHLWEVNPDTFLEATFAV